MKNDNLHYAVGRLADLGTYKTALSEAWDGCKDIVSNGLDQSTSADHNAFPMLMGSLQGQPAQNAGMNVALSSAVTLVFGAVAMPIFTTVARVAVFCDDLREGRPEVKNDPKPGF